MRITKAKILIICGILILSVAAGLLIRLFWEPRPEAGPSPAGLTVEFPKPQVPAPISVKPSAPSAIAQKPSPIEPEELEVPVLPIPRPGPQVISEKPFGSIAESFFGKINEAAKTAEEVITPSAAAPTAGSVIATTTSGGIILSLTKPQFEFLYPASFLSSLVDAQNNVVRIYDPSYQPITKITTDEQVRLIEEKIVSTLLQAGDITKEQAERFITTIRFTLPQLQATDVQKYGPSSFEEFSPFAKFLSDIFENFAPARTTPKRLFFAGLLDEISGALSPAAGAAVCGTCSASPECFQSGASTPGKAGTEQIKFACTCTGCLTALGCLSSCQGQAAIFDQTTGICGCGLGGSASSGESSGPIQ